jgi:formylglycine-generating enzyme required for sulfatase activity
MIDRGGPGAPAAATVVMRLSVGPGFSYDGAVSPPRLALLAIALVACSAREPGRDHAPAVSAMLPSGVAPPSSAELPGSVAPPPAGDAGPAATQVAPEGVASTQVAPEGMAATQVAPEGMAPVPAGPFTMGADHGGEEDEHPAHPVTVAAFYLDLTEVSNQAWDRCVAARACPPPDATSAARNGFGGDGRFRGPRQPVSAVSWDEARAYCAWLGKRLPTEAEWEKAARGTDARRYPWGNEEPTPERARFSGGGVTAEVGTHPRGDGPYGHHDLAGNVWEWVEDVYDPYAYRRPGAAEGKGSTCAQAMDGLNELRTQGKRGFTGSNPIPTECEHVLRGGAFNYPGPGLRSTNRVHHPGRYHLVMSGFRCARSAP